jgi:hypothetical protein
MCCSHETGRLRRAMSAADVAGALLQALGEEPFLRKAVEIGY